MNSDYSQVRLCSDIIKTDCTEQPWGFRAICFCGVDNVPLRGDLSLSVNFVGNGELLTPFSAT